MPTTDLSTITIHAMDPKRPVFAHRFITFVFLSKSGGKEEKEEETAGSRRPRSLREVAENAEESEEEKEREEAIEGD